VRLTRHRPHLPARLAAPLRRHQRPRHRRPPGRPSLSGGPSLASGLCWWC